MSSANEKANKVEQTVTLELTRKCRIIRLRSGGKKKKERKKKEKPADKN